MRLAAAHSVRTFRRASSTRSSETSAAPVSPARPLAVEGAPKPQQLFIDPDRSGDMRHHGCPTYEHRCRGACGLTGQVSAPGGGGNLSALPPDRYPTVLNANAPEHVYFEVICPEAARTQPTTINFSNFSLHNL